ncbi:MAG: glycosyltransferase [Lachnospiraceae bacterium]
MNYNIEKAYTHNGYIYLEGWLVGRKESDLTNLMIYGKSGCFYPAHILRIERFDVRNFYFPKQIEGNYGFMIRFAPSEEEDYILYLIAGKTLKKIPFTVHEIIDNHSISRAKNSELKSLLGIRKTTSRQKDFEKRYHYLPKISIIVSIYQKEAAPLSDMFDSILYQTYPNWELLVADCSESNEVRHSIPLNTERGERKVEYHKFPNQTNSDDVHNTLLSRATGDFCIPLEANAVLEVHALECIVQTLNKNQSYDFIYSDYDLSDSFGVTTESVLSKPDWSPEILYSADCLARISVFRTTVLKKIGGWENQTISYLKLIEDSYQVAHIPQVLYHWRQQVFERTAATPQNSTLEYKTLLQEHFNRANLPALVESAKIDSQVFHIKWCQKPNKLACVLTDNDPSIKLEQVIPSWVKALEQSKIPYQLILLSNRQSHLQELPSGTKTILFHSPEEIPTYLKEIALNTDSSHILFAYTNTIPKNPDEFVDELTGWLANPAIGIAVPRLLNSKGTILSEGVFLQQNSPVSFNRQFQLYAKSYFGHTMWYRNTSAAFPNCFALSKALLDESPSFKGPFWFISLCQWIQKEKGMRIVMTPFADAISTYDWVEEVNQKYSKEYSQFVKEQNLPLNDPYFNSSWIR